MRGLSRLGLGTAQWGMPYGVSNTGGQTTSEEVGRILRSAQTQGVSLIDTACLYGNSELALGQQGVQSFRVVSKTPRLDEFTDEEHARVALRKALNNTLDRLRQPSVYGYMVHNADDILRPDGAWSIKALEELRGEGRLQKIGVSAYDAHQIRSLLRIFTPDIIQLPINVLDQRLLRDGTLDYLHSLGVEIHARSAFLQGLLLMPMDKVPSYFRPIEGLLRLWHRSLQDLKITPLQGALAFVRDLPQLHAIVVGVEGAAQFSQVANAFCDAPPLDFPEMKCDDPQFVNPSLWKLA